MRRFLAVTLALAASCLAADFKHVGDFVCLSRVKLTGTQITPIPMKPVALHVFTDGVHVKVSTDGEDNAHTTFEIYRSDGIGRQRTGRGALEVIPGLQATSNTGGILRHLRLSRETMTITTFPGVSDQTIVSHCVAAQATSPAAKPPLP